MHGTSIYETSIPKQGIWVLGNEANGLSEATKKRLSQTLSIPRFANTQQTESLNVATATAILLSETRRKAASEM
jgi:TrmH family RNA methyltransferase